MNACQSHPCRSSKVGIRWLGALAIVVALCCTAALRAEKIEQLSPQGYVNDFASVIDSGTREKLTALCQEVDQKADAQIAVVTIHSLGGDTAQDFGNRLFEKWGVGPKGKDRGVLILLAVDDHQYWTEVGYGLEPILPDGKVGGFGRAMVPLLRQNQDGPALLQIASQVADVIAQDRHIALSQGVPPTEQQPPEEEEPSIFGIPANLFGLLFFVVIFVAFPALRFLLIALGLMSNSGGRRYGGGWMGPMGGGTGGGSWGGGGFGGFGGGSSGGGGAGGGW
jgi:uncharacterized protein